MKIVGFIGQQVRDALNEQRGFISGEELSGAIFQASNQTFSHYRGHPALYRPGQPLPPRAYQLTDVIDVALHPFLRVQGYDANPQGNPQLLPIDGEGIILFPIAVDNAGAPTLENSFQHPTAIYIDGARKITEVNDNAVQQREANSITAPTDKHPIRSSVPGGYRIRPVSVTSLRLQYLAAPPRPVYAEKPAATDSFDLVYDDDNSVDVGWTSVTAINEIIAHATRILGGQVKDQQAVGLATQTSQLGA